MSIPTVTYTPFRSDATYIAFKATCSLTQLLQEGTASWSLVLGQKPGSYRLSDQSSGGGDPRGLILLTRGKQKTVVVAGTINFFTCSMIIPVDTRVTQVDVAHVTITCVYELHLRLTDSCLTCVSSHNALQLNPLDSDLIYVDKRARNASCLVIPKLNRVHAYPRNPTPNTLCVHLV